MSSSYQNSPTSAEQDARLALLTEWLGTLGLVEAGSRRPASAAAAERHQRGVLGQQIQRAHRHHRLQPRAARECRSFN